MNWKGRTNIKLKDIMLGTLILLPIFILLFALDILSDGWKMAWSNLVEIATIVSLMVFCGFIFLLLYGVIILIFSALSRRKN